MHPLAALLLLLFHINLGVAFGAGLYETRIVIPLWFEKAGTTYRINKAVMRQLDVGRRFWEFVTTLPLTVLTLTNLVLAWSAAAPRHDWWLAAAALALIERLGTFLFFIPAAIKLERADTAQSVELSGLAKRWINANYVRSALILVSWLLTLPVIATGL